MSSAELNQDFVTAKWFSPLSCFQKHILVHFVLKKTCSLAAKLKADIGRDFPSMLICSCLYLEDGGVNRHRTLI